MSDHSRPEADRPKRPNIILAMTDDQGWGDVGYNGHQILRTPNLDAMSESGIRFDRFYAGAPVCSPTRGSCLTGRHPYRYGVFFANHGHMLPEEITMAQALKTIGYSTGHFGKWHLGTLTTEEPDSNRGGPEHPEEYSPPWDNGFDVCFSTEAKVPTYNPMEDPETGEEYGTSYWTGPGQKATENLQGDDSRIIMDRAVPFIRDAVAGGEPFLAVIWFHTPHLPVVAGPEHRESYAGLPGNRPNYYGALTAMDEQMGRLRRELYRLGVRNNTMLWFCSDNGPEGPKHNMDERPGSTAGFRGRKRDLFEGGIRVPALLEWPDRIPHARDTNIPCCTSDYYPTVMDVLGFIPESQPRPIDGISLLPLIEREMLERPTNIAFETMASTTEGPKAALIGNRYKLLSDLNSTDMLFDLKDDPAETTDIAAENPQVVRKMRSELEQWHDSCEQSRLGADYNGATEEYR